jgi:hypothetical protein
MLNCQNIRGSVVATPEHGPSGTQPTPDLNAIISSVAGQNPNWAQTPVGGCSWLSKSCSQQEVTQ